MHPSAADTRPVGHRCLIRALVAGSILAGTLLATGTSPAGAQVSGGCTATINGTDVDSARSVRDAVPVDASEVIQVDGTAPGPITGYEVYMTFGPARFKAVDGTSHGDTNSYRTKVAVDDYAKYGVGLYRVEGETLGTHCTGWAYVKVTGKFPLTTVAGVIAAGLTALGLLGMLLSRPKKKVIV